MATPATSEPAEPETATAEPVPETEPAEAVIQTATAEIESAPKPEPVETGLTLADEVEVTPEGRGRNWTVISVIVGVSAAAAGIAVLKITKVV